MGQCTSKHRAASRAEASNRAFEQDSHSGSYTVSTKRNNNNSRASLGVQPADEVHATELSSGPTDHALLAVAVAGGAQQVEGVGAQTTASGQVQTATRNDMSRTSTLVLAAKNASPMLSTICSLDGTQVFYQSSNSLEYAGVWTDREHGYIAELLSLQPPEVLESVREAVTVKGVTWSQVIKVPLSLKLVPPYIDHGCVDGTGMGSMQPVAHPDTEGNPRPMTPAKRVRSMTSRSVSAPAAMDDELASVGGRSQSQALSDSANVTTPRSVGSTEVQRRHESSSWLTQTLMNSDPVLLQPGPNSHPGLTDLDSPVLQIQQPSRGQRQRLANLLLHSSQSPTSSAGQRRSTCIDLACSPHPTLDTFDLAVTNMMPNEDERNEPPREAAADHINTHQHNLELPVNDTMHEAEPGLECLWHDVSFTPFETSNGTKAVLVLQADVTARSLFEQRLIRMTEAQLYLLERMFPRHVLERIAGLTADRFSQGGSSNTQLLPQLITQQLEQAPISTERVTVMFMDLVGFTSMSESVEPQQVMIFLNQLFTAFDELVIKHGVSKVETAGDSYIICGGLLEQYDLGFTSLAIEGPPASQTLAAQRVINFVADMFQVALSFTMPNGLPVQQRVGISTGPVACGLVGKLMPKFSLFGDTMNTASRMETTALPGHVHISTMTYELLNAPHGWTCTGGVRVKGKQGLMTTYLHEGLKLQATLHPATSPANTPGNTSMSQVMVKCMMDSVHQYVGSGPWRASSYGQTSTSEIQTMLTSTMVDTVPSGLETTHNGHTSEQHL